MLLFLLANWLQLLFVCFLHDCLWHLAAEGGEGLLFRVVVEESADDAVIDVYGSIFSC